MTPIEIQRLYLDLAHKHLQPHEITSVMEDVMAKWEFVLDQLETDPMSLDQYLDWVIKKRIIDAFIERHNLDWLDSRVRMVDLQYHDIRPDKGLYARLKKNGRVHQIVDHAEVVRAITDPPTDTRAFFRGSCLQKFPGYIRSASWNSMVFCTDGSSLDKILMDRPHFGTKEVVGDLLKNCAASELVEAVLSSNANKE